MLPLLPCCSSGLPVSLQPAHHPTTPTLKQQQTEELPHGTAWRSIEAARAAAVAAGQAEEVPMRLQKYQLRKQAELETSNAIQVAMPSHQAEIK